MRVAPEDAEKPQMALFHIPNSQMCFRTFLRSILAPIDGLIRHKDRDGLTTEISVKPIRDLQARYPPWRLRVLIYRRSMSGLKAYEAEANGKL